MKNIFFYLSLLAIIMVSCIVKEQEIEVSSGEMKKVDITEAFKIEILEEEALNIINSDVQIEVMAGGFTWVEGPLWINEEGGYLIFSDIPSNSVFKLDTSGNVSTYLNPSGYTSGAPSLNQKEPGSNGLLLNPEGGLVLMQHGDRRVAKMNAALSDPDEKYVTLIDEYQGLKLNSPNDGVYDKAGNLYFTDPPYGLPDLMDDPNKELNFQGVFCLLNTGNLVLIDSLSRPNGVNMSPDGKKLYVAVSDPMHAVWYEYDIKSPGVVSNKVLFHDVTYLVGKPGQQGMPDGLKVNKLGYVFATGPGGIWIFNSKGKPLARLHTGQRTSNCALTTDQKRLYMTADDYILSVQLK